MGRFDGQSCVLCPNPSVGVGEHVWPLWYLNEFEGEGPFSTEKSGAPMLNRRQEVATHTSVWGAHVPMCTTCNGALDTFIEKPGKPVVRQLMPKSSQHVWPTLSADECGALARWFLKIGLLLSHPAAEQDNPLVQRDPDVPRRDAVPAGQLVWLTAGDPPPDGFSVFAQRRSSRDEVESWPAPKAYIHLPTVTVGSEVLRFDIREIGIRGIDVEIVWHPGWPIDHPLVNEGRAVRLWPDPVSADFAALPEVHPGEFGFIAGGDSCSFTPEQYRSGQFAPLTLGLPQPWRTV